MSPPGSPRTRGHWRRLFATLCALAGVLILPWAAHAAASGWVGDQHAQARLITAEQASGSAGMIDAGLEIRLAPGWHAYWRDPGAAGIPPAIDWQGSRNLAGAALEWPAPSRFVLDGLQTYGYSGQVVLPIAATLEKPGAPLLLHAALAWSACRNICIPYHAVLTLALPSGVALPGPEAPLISAAREKIPGALSGLGLQLDSLAVSPDGKGRSTLALTLTGGALSAARPDLFVEGLPQGAPGRPEFSRATDPDRMHLLLPSLDASAAQLAGRPLTFTLTAGPGRAASFRAAPVLSAPGELFSPGPIIPVAILVLALLGGLILNVMPCVLPVLSLKLLSLARLAGAERRLVRGELLVTAAGLIGGFLLLAGALIALKLAGAEIGWGIQFQSPWFLAAMSLVMALFAADLWEWITIRLPGGNVTQAAARRGRYGGAFVLGLFATLLATSCTAPFVGTAVGFALSRGPLEILVIFLAMGFGMALPTLTAAAVPAAVAALPRPGPWMAWLARAFGFLLLATAVWLLTVLARVAGLAPALLAGGVTLLLLGLLAWRRYGAVRLASRRRLLRPASAGLAGVLAAAALLSPLVAGPPPRRAEAPGIWQPFVRAAIQPELARGRTVLVDVTAAWCLICRVNELTVLDRNPVAARLAAPEVLAMRADWTRPDAAITAYLESFGRYGVPLTVVYGPGAPAGIVLPDLVNTTAVIRALDRAGNASRAARR